MPSWSIMMEHKVSWSLQVARYHSKAVYCTVMKVYLSGPGGGLEAEAGWGLRVNATPEKAMTIESRKGIQRRVMLKKESAYIISELFYYCPFAENKMTFFNFLPVECKRQRINPIIPECEFVKLSAA